MQWFVKKTFQMVFITEKCKKEITCDEQQCYKILTNSQFVQSQKPLNTF